MEVAMTSTTQRSDFLGVDEDMEISSEAGRGHESDIEIFDLEEDITTNAADDEMVDDNDNEQKDEVMDEEYGRENTVDMDDEIVFDEDVEFTEVAEVPPPHNPLLEVSGAQTSSGKEAQASTLSTDPSASEEHTRSPKEVPVAELPESTTATSEEVNAQSTEQTLPEGHVIDGDDAAGDDKDNAQEQTKNEVQEGDAEKGAVQQTSTELEGEVSYGQSAEPKGDSEGEPAVHASLPHEVKVIYKRNEMCLFAPSDPEDSRTYLLQDRVLLHSPILELFPACRAVLADSIVASDELHLEIPDLRLRLSEKTASQPAATLSNVIDVYLALSYNDSSDEPGPLYLNLDVVPDFQSRLDSLHDLASEGQGFSSFIEPDDSSDEEEWGQEGEELGQKPEEALTTEASAETVTDLTNRADVIEDELETKSSHQQSTENMNSGSSAEKRDEIPAEVAGPEIGGDQNDYDTTSPTGAEAYVADQDASDTSVTVQEEHEYPPEGPQAPRNTGEGHREKPSNSLQDEDEHAHGDDFDFDLGAGNEDDDNWHHEDVEVPKLEESMISGSKAGEAVEAIKRVPTGTEHPGISESTSEPTQGKIDNPNLDQRATSTLAADVDENRDVAQHEDEWQVLDEVVKAEDGAESTSDLKDQTQQHSPGPPKKKDVQEEILQDDDDVIDFSEDDEAKETVSPSISHKRSRSELGTDIDSTKEGNELKKVKT